MTRRIRAAALLVAALGGADAAWASRWPSWAEIPPTSLIDERYGGEDSVVLLDDWSVTLQDGARTGVHRRVTRILTDKGSEDAGMVLKRDSFNRFSRLKLWVLEPRGKVKFFDEDDGTVFSAAERQILDDAEILAVRPPGVAAGSTVAVEYRFDRSAKLPQDIYRIQGDAPVHRFVLRLDARGGWRARARVVSIANPGPEETAGTATWELTSLPAKRGGEDEDSRVPPRAELALDYIPPGAAPSFESWADVAAWVGREFDLAVGATPLLDALVEKIRGSGEDPVEASSRIVRGLRYFGIEIGWGGFRPRPPETTLARAFGDCKDKSFLMVALLRRLGVPAVPVLAMAPSDDYVHDGLPSPFVFNHAIVGVPWSGRATPMDGLVVDAPGVGPLRLLDPTLPAATGIDVPVELEGGAGLVADPRTTALVRFPLSSSGDNREDTEATGRLLPGGGIAFTLRRTLAGASRGGYEGHAGTPLDEDELRRKVFGAFSAAFPSIADLEVRRWSRPPRGGWSYDVTFDAQGALASFGGLDVLQLPRLAAPKIFAPPTGERGDDTRETLPRTVRETWELETSDRVVVETPGSFVVENKLGHVRVDSAIAAGRVRIEREIVVEASSISRGDAKEAEELQRALRRANGAALVLAGAAADRS